MKTLLVTTLMFLISGPGYATISTLDRPALNPTWTLPAAFDSFTITHGTVTRLDTGVSNYKIRVNAHLPAPEQIVSLQVSRYPNLILIDKLQKIGTFEEKLDATGADVYLETGGAGENTPFPEGLYLLNIEMSDGSLTQGWFILDKALSASTPYLNHPYVGQTFDNGNPTFSWQNFFSPEYKSYEHRKVYTRVYQGPQVVWAAYQHQADVNHITVGCAQSQEGVSVLPSGHYDAHLVYREVRPYGTLWLGREYRTIAPFSIQ